MVLAYIQSQFFHIVTYVKYFPLIMITLVQMYYAAHVEYFSKHVTGLRKPAYLHVMIIYISFSVCTIQNL